MLLKVAGDAAFIAIQGDAHNRLKTEIIMASNLQYRRNCRRCTLARQKTMIEQSAISRLCRAQHGIERRRKNYSEQFR